MIQREEEAEDEPTNERTNNDAMGFYDNRGEEMFVLIVYVSRSVHDEKDFCCEAQSSDVALSAPN